MRHGIEKTHKKLQMCLFTIKTLLTRGNNTECVKALHGERRTKPIFVSQLALPPDWAAPLRETSHRKSAASLHTAGHINVQMYARNFEKSQNYWAKWGSCSQIVGIMNNYHTVYGTFLNFLQNNDFSGLIEKNPNVVWSYCFPVTVGRIYLRPIFLFWRRRHWRCVFSLYTWQFSSTRTLMLKHNILAVGKKKTCESQSEESFLKDACG